MQSLARKSCRIQKYSNPNSYFEFLFKNYMNITIFTGNYGFILPAEQIIPTAEEVWAFHTTVLREIMSMEQ